MMLGLMPNGVRTLTLASGVGVLFLLLRKIICKQEEMKRTGLMSGLFLLNQ